MVLQKEPEIICLDDSDHDTDTELNAENGIVIPSTPIQPENLAETPHAVETVDIASSSLDVEMVPMTPEDASQTNMANSSDPNSNLSFRNPNWSARSSVVAGSDSAISFLSKLLKSAEASPSTRNFSLGADSAIESDDVNDEDEPDIDNMYTRIPMSTQGRSRSFEMLSSGSEEIEIMNGLTSRRRDRAASFIMLDDEEEEMEMAGVGHSTLAPGEKRNGAWNGKVIDLLDDSDIEEIVCLGARRIDKRKGRSQKNSSALEELNAVKQLSKRNSPMAHPWARIDGYQRRKSFLKANKTVEIPDGSFMRITDIFQNLVSKEVKIRGLRLQRLRDMNGYLEKKMNEVAIFLEVDLDDAREPEEQAAVEIALGEAGRMRNVRFTNLNFPECRNVSTSGFRNTNQMAQEGGLTVRWRFTTKYASGRARYNNIWKERILMRLGPEECMGQFARAGANLRAEWRGETVRGGSFKPGSQSEEPDVTQQVPSIESSPEPDVEQPGLDSLRISGQPTTQQQVQCPSLQKHDTNPLNTITKRKRSSCDLQFAVEDAQAQKRMRSNQEIEIETTRRRVSEIDIDEGQHKKEAPVIDLTISPKTPSIPTVIDLSNSDVSIPPPTGYIISKSSVSQTPITRSAGQRLTYGDAFCGAGGASRGAVMAGFHVKWGFDHSKHACTSWRENFPYAKCYEMHCMNFVDIALQAETKGNPCLMKVDVLHLSPPCQYFSPAHTVDGPEDENNVASLFGVLYGIKVAKPRVVTLEQTFGLASPRFRLYFQSLVQMFTAHNFSVRWATVPLAQWGLPQRRHRLIMIGSCPGEVLPRIPPPTHSEGGADNLQPFVSVNSILRSIPSNAPDHNIESVQFGPHRQMRPWDGNKILPRAMTTSGGQNYHPSGKRDLTLREYAALQGFPMVHVFKGSYVKKQIGNAVPPFCAKVLFESIKKDLDAADGIVDDAMLIE